MYLILTLLPANNFEHALEIAIFSSDNELCSPGSEICD